MKKVFLIGDSIRLGYCPAVMEKTKGRYIIYRPKENCRFASYTFRYITEWANDCGDAEHVDVVHWNNGLWDVGHYFGEDAFTEPEQYKMYLLRIYRRIRAVFPMAKIIFATSTPVLEDRFFGILKRYNSEIREYNQIAVDALTPLGVEIDDLYAVARQLPDTMHRDHTHFTPEGCAVLADAVIASIEKALEK